MQSCHNFGKCWQLVAQRAASLREKRPKSTPWHANACNSLLSSSGDDAGRDAGPNDGLRQTYPTREAVATAPLAALLDEPEPDLNVTFYAHLVFTSVLNVAANVRCAAGGQGQP